jgi:hypothetical protein
MQEVTEHEPRRYRTGPNLLIYALTRAEDGRR